MNTKSEINSFLKDKKFALVGISSNPKKFSRMVYKELTAKGYDLFPVNPKMDEIDGKKVYHNIIDLPEDVNSVLLMTPKDLTPKVIDEAVKRGIGHIWVQQGANSKESLDTVKETDAKIVHNKCIMMFADPVKGVHGFHRFLARLFNKVPD